MGEYIQKISNSDLVFIIIFTLFFCHVLDLSSELYAQTGSNCEMELIEAEEKYTNGKFDEAMNIVQKCLNKEDISEVNEKRGLKLIVKIHLAKNDDKEAKNTVLILLEKFPDFKPDLISDLPEFRNLVEQTKLEMENQEKTGWWEENWYYVAGGSALVGATLYFILEPDDTKPEQQDKLPGLGDIWPPQ